MEAIEAWFIERLDASWFEMNSRMGFGTPFVQMSLDFRSRMTPDDTIETEVLLGKLGRSSLGFALGSRASGDRRLCWTGQFTCAFVSNDTFAAIPVPNRFLTALEREADLANACLTTRTLTSPPPSMERPGALP